MTTQQKKINSGIQLQGSSTENCLKTKRTSSAQEWRESWEKY